MAWWLLLQNLFLLVTCVSASRFLSFLERGTNRRHSLELSFSESNITTVKKASSLDFPWPTPYVPPAPVENNISLTPAVNAQNVTNLQAAPTIKCTSAYGEGLNVASCQEAWELLPTSTTRRTFGPRTEGDFDVALPFRVLSSE